MSTLGSKLSDPTSNNGTQKLLDGEARPLFLIQVTDMIIRDPALKPWSMMARALSWLDFDNTKKKKEA